MIRRPGTKVEKDPDSDEPYGIDWTSFLAELGTGVLVATSTWVISGTAGVTYHDPEIVTGSKMTRAFFLGAPASECMVTNHIVTNSAPQVVADRSFYFTRKQQ